MTFTWETWHQPGGKKSSHVAVRNQEWTPKCTLFKSLRKRREFSLRTIVIQSNRTHQRIFSQDTRKEDREQFYITLCLPWVWGGCSGADKQADRQAWGGVSKGLKDMVIKEVNSGLGQCTNPPKGNLGRTSQEGVSARKKHFQWEARNNLG